VSNRCYAYHGSISENITGDSPVFTNVSANSFDFKNCRLLQHAYGDKENKKVTNKHCNSVTKTIP